jgi:YggT family protein
MTMPTGIAGFIWFVLSGLLNILMWAIIINAVMSWLLAFDVINYRNNVVRMVGRTLDAITAPVLWPLRKVIPPLGGLDVTPIIALLIIQGILNFLLPHFIIFIAQYTG